MSRLFRCAVSLAFSIGPCAGQMVQTGSVPVDTVSANWACKTSCVRPLSSLQVNWQSGQSGEAYVINQGVTVVDIATQAINRVIPVSLYPGPSYSCLSATGLIAIDVASYMATTPTTEFLVDPSAGLVRSLSVPFFGAQSCVFSTDGKVLYEFGFPHEGGSPPGGQLVALDVASGKVTGTWGVPNSPLTPVSGIQVLAGGQIVALTTDSNHQGVLYVIDPSAGTMNSMTLNFQPINYSLAPNGLLYFLGCTPNCTAAQAEWQPVIDPLLVGSATDPIVKSVPQQFAFYMSWPTNDPWYVYVPVTAEFANLTIDNWQPVNEFPGNLPNCLGYYPADYYGIASRRDTTGSDTLLMLCNGELDFFSDTQPPTLYSVANSASFQPVPAAPGEFITLSGYELGSPGEYDTPGASVARKLGSTSVELDGQPLRLYFVGQNQVNAALPQNVSIGTHTIAFFNGGAAAPPMNESPAVVQRITVVDQNIAAFTWVPNPDSAPAGTAPIVTNSHYQLIGNPALSQGYAQLSPGDTGIIWATGGGATNPLVDDTIVSPAGPFRLVTTPPVLVDHTNAVVSYAGRAPGTASLDQINFVVPAGLSSGPHDLILGAITYKAGLWIR